jgi:small subunit ribosomal protein S16
MLVIRLRQQGMNSRQSFRLVVTNERSPRDGKYIEMLGWYNPFGAETKNLQIDVSRLQHRLATASDLWLRNLLLMLHCKCLRKK